MWRKQIRAERAAEQASQMAAKAKALKEAAMARPGSSGNEGSPSEDVSENEADNRSGSSTLVTPSLVSKALAHNAETLRDGASSISGSTDDENAVDDSLEGKEPTNNHPQSKGKASDAPPDRSSASP